MTVLPARPDAAAKPNLHCPSFHHSFLSSFAVAFIAWMSTAEKRRGNFDIPEEDGSKTDPFMSLLPSGQEHNHTTDSDQHRAPKSKEEYNPESRVEKPKSSLLRRTQVKPMIIAKLAVQTICACFMSV